MRDSIILEYQEIIDSLDLDIKKIKAKDQLFGWSRLIVFLVILYCIYGVLTKDPSLFGIFLGIGFIALLFTINIHAKIRERRKDIEAEHRLFSREKNYMLGDFSDLKTGATYTSPKHIYSNDLNLFGEFSLFRHMNRTSTFRGEEKLVNLILSNQTEDIKNRQIAIEELSNSSSFRNEFMKQGVRYPTRNHVEPLAQQWIEKSYSRGILYNKYILYLLAAISIAALSYFFYSLTLNTFYIFIVIFAINNYIGKKALDKASEYYHSISGLDLAIANYSKLIELIEENDFNSKILVSLKEDLKGKKIASKELSKLKTIINTYDTKENDVGVAVFNGLFLFYPHIFNKIEEWKIKHKDSVSIWLDSVSTMDMYVSLGNYTYQHPQFNFPEISNNYELHAIDIHHPLIDRNQSVGNDISLQKDNFVILTGSNMSGKSTFLRTIGINLLLFKMGCPVHAQEFKAYPFVLATSMNVSDELSENTSYFLAEIKRLKAIQNLVKDSNYTFLLLDEILRGTNSDDKRTGTMKFLEKITAMETMGIIATHDIEVADLRNQEPSKFKNYYFSSNLVENELEFDYKLKEGVCHSPNATLLLQNEGII